MKNKIISKNSSPIGQIPLQWEILKGIEISTKITKGSSPKWQGFNYSSKGVLFVTSENVRDGIIDISKPKYLPEAFNKKQRSSILSKGDILINIVGASIGRSAIFNCDIKSANINQAVCLMRLKPNVDNSFISYYLQHPKIIQTLIGNQSESARPNLNLMDIRNFNFIIPSLKEQIKIANILNSWDNAIEIIEKLISAKEKFKNGLMQKLLSGKKRFKGFEKEKWEVINFIDLSDKSKKWSFTGGPFGSNLKTSDYTDAGIRIIQLQNIGDGTFYDDYKIYTSKEKADELLSCNIYPGEIIISKMGDPVARACFIPHIDKRYLMASDGIRLSIDEKKFDKKFIHDYINHSIFRKKAIEASTGSTRQRIGLDDLKKLTLKVPSRKEQEKIGKLLSSIDKDREILEQKLSNLKDQKKGLMQTLLTGKVRVKV